MGKGGRPQTATRLTLRVVWVVGCDTCSEGQGSVWGAPGGQAQAAESPPESGHGAGGVTGGRLGTSSLHTVTSKWPAERPQVAPLGGNAPSCATVL